jgi:uncharacterized protein YoxC
VAKDINIKVKVEGGPESQQQLDGVAKAAGGVGQTTQQAEKPIAGFGESAKRAGEKTKRSFEEVSEKGSIVDKVLQGIQGSALRMVVGFFGIQQVIGFVQRLSQSLDEVAEKQRKLLEKTLTASEGGQKMEAATGTVGKQDYWTKQIAGLQKTGGLKSPEDAVALMMGMQEATKGIGGVQNRAVAAMLQRLAPRLGASNKSASDLSAIFEAASKEGIAPQGLESFISGKLGVSDAQAREYQKTPLGRSRSNTGEQSILDQTTPPGISDWQLRMKDAQSEFDRRAAKGEDDFLIKDENEPQAIALESLVRDIEAMEESTTDPAKKARLQSMKALARDRIRTAHQGPLSGSKWMYEDTGRKISQSMNELGGGNTQGGVTINHNHITNHNPIAGGDAYRKGARYDPNDI